MLFWLSASVAVAQERWEESGEIESAEVVIEKDRAIELPFQSRNFEKIPPVPTETGGIRQDYAFPSLDLTIPFTSVDIKALKLQQEPLEKYHNNLVKLGYGNYNSPLAELYLYSKQNERYLVGLQARHLSFGKGPVDGKNSASSESLFKIDGSHFGKRGTVSADAYYGLQGWRFYGYDPALAVTEGEDSLRRSFNRYGASLSLTNAADATALAIKSSVAFRGQNDNLDMSENWLSVNTTLTLPLQDHLKGRLDVFGDLIGFTDSLSVGRQRIGVTPSVVFDGEKYEVTAGLRYVYQSDTAVAASQVYPVLRGTYQLTSFVAGFAEVSGNNQLHTWQSQTARNPYLAPGADIHNSNKILYAELGAKGDIAFVSYRAGYARSVYKEFGVFLNAADDPARFLIQYDTGNFKVSDFFLEADFYAGSSLTLGADANFYTYTSDTFEQPWHLPRYKAGINVNYLAFDKIKARMGMIYMGGIVGYDTQAGQSRELKAAVDLFVDLDYFLSNRAGIFLQFHNLANQSYELVSNYPVRGLTAKAGFSYSF